MSVGATFAADNATDVVAVDNEITIDEPLAVEQDAQVVSDGEKTAVHINNSNINQYIDEAGSINENVTADEFIFDGTFEKLNLTVERPIILTGGIFNNPNFEIYSSNVILQNFTILQDKGYSSIFVAGSDDNHTENVTISDVAIGFTDDKSGAGAIPVQVMYSDNFVLRDSSILYNGSTNGYYLNNIIRIESSKDALIYNNKFIANLVSVPVGWAEVPAGSGIWVSSPMSEGIVVKNSEGAVFNGNNVTIYCANASGSWDTIYAVDFSGSDNAVIAGNDIVANGNTYIYAIILSGDDFVIRANNISSTGVYYADGIDIEGPATGVIEDNNIDVKADTTAYGIYSGMNGQNVSANYAGNNITGKAYSIFGFSLGDVESNVKDNYINLDGNYTTGIAARTGVLNVTNNRIVLISSEKGNETIWEGFGVAARGILVISGNATIMDNIIATSGTGILLNNTDVADVENNFINVVANDDEDAYAIFANHIGDLKVMNNNVDYEGATQGTGINQGVLIFDADGAIVANNNFTLDLVSCYVPWAEVPAGSGNWVSSPVSEGIVIAASDNVAFAGNIVNVTYNNVSGSYDTIYAVDFLNANSAVIAGNDIVANGNTYIYGIILSGDDFVIRGNNISSTGVYYANGIDIEGPASGVVEDNKIDVKADTTAYGIYSGMNGQNVSANYTGNNITGAAYNIFGFSLGDVESNIDTNDVILTGNYTTGVAYRGNAITLTNNTIFALGSNEGNETIWEAFGVESIGVKVVKGNVKIADNKIVTTGDYPINVQDNVAVVNDNYLIGKRFIGDEGVDNDANADVYNNTPAVENKTATMISIVEVDGNFNITGVVTYINGTPVANDEVSYAIDGVNRGVVKTDENGTFIIPDVGYGKIDVLYGGDSFIAPANATIVLKDLTPVRDSTVIVGNNFTQYAIEYNAGERGQNFTTQLVDSMGNPIANKTVLIGYNGKTLERITNATGHASVQINLRDANRLTFAVTFLGDEDYNATMSVYLITIQQKPVTITAAAKSYKATAKTKKYTVTLKTIKGASADGKTYFAAGKKVTMKLNGKTYTAKTNAKGQATFSLKITKKGKYTASIKYAGDTTYKAASKSVKITIK